MRTHYRQPYIRTVFSFLVIFSVVCLFFVSKSLAGIGSYIFLKFLHSTTWRGGQSRMKIMLGLRIHYTYPSAGEADQSYQFILSHLKPAEQ